MRHGEQSGQSDVPTHERRSAIKSKARWGATEVSFVVAGHGCASACGPSDLSRAWGPELNRSALRRWNWAAAHASTLALDVVSRQIGLGTRPPRILSAIDDGCVLKRAMGFTDTGLRPKNASDVRGG